LVCAEFVVVIFLFFYVTYCSLLTANGLGYE
jgi:hypothetical protein